VFIPFHPEYQMPEKIDINSASVGELTQLPGVAKNMSYNIINHRIRHGFFTAFEELAEVKDFPVHRLDEIRERAELIQPSEGRPTETVPVPRRLKKEHISEVSKQNRGYTKAMRSTRRPDRLHDAHDHSQHGGSGNKAA
jgi:hypothetical protein